MQTSVAQDPVELAVGNWHRFGWGAVDSMAAATSITRVHQVMTARIDAALKPLGLNFSRFEVLALLSFTREGQLPMGKIGDRLQVNAASVTNTIGRLEADGLVERVAHPTDGRATLARILEPGREAAARAAVALAEIHFGLDGLGPRETASVTEAFGGFRRANGDFA
ncbi:MAG: MarR family transcriptional regulator [Acidimicrobiales bacterium]|nr:MarR family transcriptional regulator [Acidimicrobiales bacterium]